MNKYAAVSSLKFVLAIIGLGIIYFLWPAFRPVFLPVPPTVDFTVLPIVLGLSFVLAGLDIILNKRRNVYAAFLAAELMLYFLLGLLPNRLKYRPDILDVWANSIRLTALIAGAFLIVNQPYDRKINGRLKPMEKIMPVGKCIFSLMLVLFGLDHFFYSDLIRSLIPQWIPLKSLWIYLSGTVLLGAGIFIGLNILKSQASLWLALILFLWLILLDLHAFFFRLYKDEIYIVSSLESLAFCGTALLLYAIKENRQV